MVGSAIATMTLGIERFDNRRCLRWWAGAEPVRERAAHANETGSNDLRGYVKNVRGGLVLKAVAIDKQQGQTLLRRQRPKKSNDGSIEKAVRITEEELTKARFVQFCLRQRFAMGAEFMTPSAINFAIGPNVESSAALIKMLLGKHVLKRVLKQKPPRCAAPRKHVRKAL